MNWDFQGSKERLAKEWARIKEAGLNIQRLDFGTQALPLIEI